MLHGGDGVIHFLSLVIHMLEGFGVFVILFAALRAFIKYAKCYFNFNNDTVKIEFAKALALGLEFKLGSEILKTVLIRTLDEMIVLGAIIVLRMLLTFVIHWEIQSDIKHCNIFLEEKDSLKQKPESIVKMANENV